jgi:hypothetical protein
MLELAVIFLRKINFVGSLNTIFTMCFTVYTNFHIHNTSPQILHIAMNIFGSLWLPYQSKKNHIAWF